MTIGSASNIEQPLTPDFYSYGWHALESAEVDGRFIILRWPDGSSLRAFDVWLWENSVGDRIDTATRESVADPADLDDDLAVGSVVVNEAGALTVTWQPGNTNATYHPGWLRHVAEKNFRPDSFLPDPVAWLADDIGQPPTHDGADVLDDPAVLDRWVDDLLRYGIARLSGLSVDPDLTLTLMSRLGAVRDTNFGHVWDVKAILDPDSTANTNMRLGPHTDLPTRETPPGFQFLHCVANTTEGGYSTMADGLAVAAYIADVHPEEYEALTTLNWVFFNRSPTADHRWSGPIIDLGVHGAPLTLRAFHPVRGFPDMDEADLPRAYAALKVFSATAAEARFQLRYPFREGDLVGFNNRRILHGRDAYSSGGLRHLRVLYMDHDEVYSYARQAARRRATPQP